MPLKTTIKPATIDPALRLETPTEPIYYDTSLLTDEDIQLFKTGRHFRLYEKLGAHPASRNGVPGIYFAVWAPNAREVSLIGDFNHWDKHSHPLGARWDHSGIWEGFVPYLQQGVLYKFHVVSNHGGYAQDKKDPFSFHCEEPPQTASYVSDQNYSWNDAKWMRFRRKFQNFNRPVSIYEVHPGSWRRVVEEGNRFLTYRELANYLVDYVHQMGFTHIELMPIMHHPFYGSWGYQTLGYFSPCVRYGSPADLKYMIDCFHQNDIGVILDWVPSHFPADAHGLGLFDGTHLYEHDDPQKGFHPDWKTYIFNNGRNEVKEFLISSALFWLDVYHADGLRVDAVASMLYLDYSRKEGEWTPNVYGGRENIESIEFMRELNQTVRELYPDTLMIAEESTAWGNVSRPVDQGGLGFHMKWNMGWMNDTLEYLKNDPIHRKYHHNELTFSMLYAFTENFMLSLSHDEVVHGKGSLLKKMPCDDWQKFANLRLLYAYMFAHPGKKLLFMGDEFAQWSEWNHEGSLDWHLVQQASHKGIQQMVKQLNRIYREESALYFYDFGPEGFEWISHDDWQNSVLAFVRKGKGKVTRLIAVCNFTPVPRTDYRIGAPEEGRWRIIFNSDAAEYGGSGMIKDAVYHTDDISFHGRTSSLSLTLPPLGVLYLKHE